MYSQILKLQQTSKVTKVLSNKYFIERIFEALKSIITKILRNVR